MIDNVRRARRLFIIISSALYLFIFLIFYIPNYVFSELDVWEGPSLDIYLIVRELLEKLVGFFIPAAIGAILFATEGRIGRALLRSVTLNLPILIYSIPYCYLYSLSLGYDSINGLLISVGLSAAGLFIQWLHAAALYFVAGAAAALPLYRRSKEALPPMRAARSTSAEKRALWKAAWSDARSEIRAGRVFSFESAGNVGIFAAVFVDFAFRVVMELISTVSFFIEAEGLFSASEIFTIIFTYLFLLAELILIYFLCCVFKNRALRDEKI